MEKQQWRATALAMATAVLLGVSASDASALALGRVTVQSALGEPLRADIEIPEINADEIASLRAAVASPDAFRAAGFDFNPSLSGLTITLQKRADGRHFLRLTSSRPINDPFIDLILEANWSSGRIVRDYTMLFDPPNLRQTAPPLAAQVPAAPAARAPAEQARPTTAPSPSVSALPPLRTGPQRAAATPTPASPKAASGDGKQVTVQSGETAGKIAAAHKPADVSLDQMLVALLRANPDAFVGGNVNRLRAGAVLEVPSSEDVGLVPSGEASQTIVAQSRDFNEFRRRLAEGLPTTRIGAADRQSSGRVQAQVDEKKASATAPDKLTLSKGAVAGKANADQIARQRAAKDASTRVAELNKNISDLNKLTGPTGSASAAKPGIAVPLGTASGARPAAAPAAPVVAASAPKPVAAASATKPASAPIAAAPVAASAAKPASAAASVAKAASAPVAAATPMTAAPVAVTPAFAPAAAAPASAPEMPAAGTMASAASAPASAAAPVAGIAPEVQAPASAPVVAAAPAATASKPKPAAAPIAPAETSLVDDLLENPIIPATVGGLLAFLLGFAFYRAQQRKKSTQVDSSFLESRLQPDSFFGASGGQRIDTNEGNATGSSMVYSPSQLDAAGDVDPVAEADVYLAYGRDLQAEEILKEAMRTTPNRVAVHSKLLEIYSKRRDAKAFELVATEAYGLTRGEGSEWEHICELGQELDPSNSLYRPGGQPPGGAAAAAAAAAVSTGAFGATATTQPMHAASAPPVDLDLDLDFSLGDDEPTASAAPTVMSFASHPTLPLTVPPASQPEPMPSLDMDFGSATVTLDPPAVSPKPVRLEAPDLNLTLPDVNSLNFTPEPPKAPAATPTAAAPAADAGMIEFDLGALSLDLDSPPPVASRPAAAEDASLGTTGAPLSTGGFDDTGGDPLATKLALAQEFNAIGDPDGARSLAQEVLAEASGDLKSKAQRFLAEIS
ncbi:FimV/HubP family polar landmark protein [Ramlibacter sp. WS9]|uniref:FimV/HubP family polar landmark protein n=1 Tax=Ramlibacter sp. WS9 TaxID=1882741 RepID=UPI001E31798F|nr:FimV/HubP family polar landmark protein [Ramlibacter sp. WS9]